MRRILDGIVGLIAGAVLVVVGLFASSGAFPDSTWEIMGRQVPSTEWGGPLSILGVIALIIGAVITFSGYKKKQ